MPWPPPHGWKAALVANHNEQLGISTPVETPVFHPMLPPQSDHAARDFSTMDPVLKARWMQIIGGAKCRDDAVALLCVPRRLMNDFADQFMPDHKWPDSRPGDQRRAEFEERQTKRREGQQEGAET